MEASDQNQSDAEYFIKTLKELKRDGTAKAFRVLDTKTDPFWVLPSRERNARWITGLWEKYGDDEAVWPGYDRGIHYLLVGLNIICPWGLNRKVHHSEKYMNVMSDWDTLVRAIKDARTWGLIPWNAIRSMRPSGLIQWINYGGSLTRIDELPFEGYDGKIDHTLLVDVPELKELEKARIHEDTFEFEVEALFDDLINNHTGQLTHQRYQPYYVAVVSEKVGLRTVAGRTRSELGHGFDFLDFEGQASATEIKRFATYLVYGGPKEHPIADKKIRIFYLSDFDYSGRIMVPAFIWKLYFILLTMGKQNLDIKIKPLALTAEQVEKFDLPPGPVPVKSLGSKTLQDRWLRDFGKIIEVDSLMGLYPGELEKIIVEAISPYIDRDLEAEMEEQYSSWCGETFDSVTEDLEHLRQPWEDAHEALSTAVDELNEAIEEAGILDELKKLTARIDKIKEKHKIDELVETYENTMSGIELDTKRYAGEFEKPESELDVVEEEEDWLFDSTRPPTEQAEILRKYRP